MVSKNFEIPKHLHIINNTIIIIIVIIVVLLLLVQIMINNLIYISLAYHCYGIT